MPSNNLLKSLCWIFQLTDHGISDISKPDDVGVCLILSITLFSALLSFEARLIEINIITHSNSLC